MVSLAAGTKVFMRPDKLEQLLESLENTQVKTLYLADDGEVTDEKAEIYNRDFTFKLELLDLEYDSGLGFGRKRIVEECDEDFLLIVDPDHVVPRNLSVLIEQLQALPDVGGIAGNLIEPEFGRMKQNAHDLRTNGNTLVRETDTEAKDIELVAGNPFVRFDFIPNAVVFQMECLHDYCWDPEYVISKEHLDFYEGHRRQTDWEFGISPNVNFLHYPGGGDSYMEERYSSSKRTRSEKYFLEKWEYDEIVSKRNYWFDTHREISIEEKIEKLVEDESLSSLVLEAISKGPSYARALFRS